MPEKHPPAIQLIIIHVAYMQGITNFLSHFVSLLDFVGEHI